MFVPMANSPTRSLFSSVCVYAQDYDERYPFGRNDNWNPNEHYTWRWAIQPYVKNLGVMIGRSSAQMSKLRPTMSMCVDESQFAPVWAP